MNLFRHEAGCGNNSQASTAKRSEGSDSTRHIHNVFDIDLGDYFTTNFSRLLVLTASTLHTRGTHKILKILYFAVLL